MVYQEGDEPPGIYFIMNGGFEIRKSNTVNSFAGGSKTTREIKISNPFTKIKN